MKYFLISFLCLFIQNCFAMVDVNNELSKEVVAYIQAAESYKTLSRSVKKEQKLTQKQIVKQEQKNRLKKIKKLVLDSDAVVSSELLDRAKNTPNLKNTLQASIKQRAKAKNQIFIDCTKGLDRIAESATV